MEGHELRCTRHILVFVSSPLPSLIPPVLQQTSNCQASIETVNVSGPGEKQLVIKI